MLSIMQQQRKLATAAARRMLLNGNTSNANGSTGNLTASIIPKPHRKTPRNGQSHGGGGRASQDPLQNKQNFQSQHHSNQQNPRELLESDPLVAAAASSTSRASQPARRAMQRLQKEEEAIVATHSIHVEKLATSVGVRLTPNELQCLQKQLDSNNDGLVTISGLERIGKKAIRERMTREICLSAICNASNPLDRVGVKVVNFFDYSGTALFAVVGTQVAGEIGNMNMVGCCLVGCAAAMGGGSLNTMMYGGASPIIGNPGVR